MRNIKYIISIQTYNSLQNADQILSEINKFNLNIAEIIIIDNNSNNMSFNEKENLYNNLKKKYNYNVTFILNKENYGIGGSFKILFKYINNKNFDYWINLQSSGRYELNQVIKNLIDIQSSQSNFDYYLHSRFLISENTKNYDFLRKVANLVFIKLTKILTKCNFSDPGMSVFMIKKDICDIFLNEDFNLLTNDSHFPHFMNVILFKHIKTYKEVNINWKEGNVKSHLNSFTYPLLLLLNLILFSLKGSFIKYPYKNKFDYKLLKN